MNQSDDIINRRDVINAMWKALFDYEALTEKQFKEHKELKFEDWFQHRIFVQNMHAECMKTVLSLPSAESKTKCIVQIKIDRDDMEDLVNKKINEIVDKIAKPKTGKWIDTEFLLLKECSCCHYRWGMYDVEDFDYCPSCGAKMRSEEE